RPSLDEHLATFAARTLLNDYSHRLADERRPFLRSRLVHREKAVHTYRRAVSGSGDGRALSNHRSPSELDGTSTRQVRKASPSAVGFGVTSAFGPLPIHDDNS